MKNLFYKIGAWISVLPLLFMPAGVYAQLSTGSLTQVGEKSGLSSGQRDLPSIIGGLIKALLGVLGIVFVILIIYAGVLYMTAGGDDDKVKKSKQLMIQAVIGIVIIVAAYAIANFVISTLVTATA